MASVYNTRHWAACEVEMRPRRDDISTFEECTKVMFYRKSQRTCNDADQLRGPLAWNQECNWIFVQQRRDELAYEVTPLLGRGRVMEDEV